MEKKYVQFVGLGGALGLAISGILPMIWTDFPKLYAILVPLGMVIGYFLARKNNSKEK